MWYTSMESPIGTLLAAVSEQGLCTIEFTADEMGMSQLKAWSTRWTPGIIPERIEQPGSLEQLSRTIEQLEEYFNGTRQSFDLKLDLRGTPFQLKVWQQLQRIPYGTVCSYKDIAIRIGQPKAVRAVGGANNRNPIPIIVPCHRVIGAGGALVGFGGGVDTKEKLLHIESTPWQHYRNG
jgi:methylated-DNA-[protein]-cysteine S-methyltransferase